MRSARNPNGLRDPRPCKIGTMPGLVDVHGADAKRLSPGFWARIRETAGQPWQRVLVTRVDPDGYFMADR